MFVPSPLLSCSLIKDSPTYQWCQVTLYDLSHKYEHLSSTGRVRPPLAEAMLNSFKSKLVKHMDGVFMASKNSNNFNSMVDANIYQNGTTAVVENNNSLKQTPVFVSDEQYDGQLNSLSTSEADWSTLATIDQGENSGYICSYTQLAETSNSIPNTIYLAEGDNPIFSSLSVQTNNSPEQSEQDGYLANLRQDAEVDFLNNFSSPSSIDEAITRYLISFDTSNVYDFKDNILESENLLIEEPIISHGENIPAVQSDTAGTETPTSPPNSKKRAYQELECDEDEDSLSVSSSNSGSEESDTENTLYPLNIKGNAPNDTKKTQAPTTKKLKRSPTQKSKVTQNEFLKPKELKDSKSF